MLNPYLDALKDVPLDDTWMQWSHVPQYATFNWSWLRERVHQPAHPDARLDADGLEFRRPLVHRFAWAIPTEPVIRDIASFAAARVVEMGAGTGYWAWLLEQVGCTVSAYDIEPSGPGEEGGGESTRRTFTHVRRGTPPDLASYDAAWTLLLCWPPYNDPMARESLEAFRGERLVFVGESKGGCTADDPFFRRLHRDWRTVTELAIPQWSGVHDQVFLFARQRRRRQTP